MNKNKAKKYCIAHGCRNNDKITDHTFFYVPSRQKDAERARKWFKLLGREDLLEKKEFKPSSYSVCSEHFDTSSIIIIKRLTENAVPSLLLTHQPSSELEHISSESKDTKTFSKSTEESKGERTLMPRKLLKTNAGSETNEDPLLKQRAPTSKLFSEGTPRKKLSGEPGYGAIIEAARTILEPCTVC
ncbi:uncharacterized protein, partial [Choristoneura fumiferana]|uniref:uncharacterized protein n=1 Tax=Choristoneura fumiferana TaxID=7141 RepID=UPI003D156FD0